MLDKERCEQIFGLREAENTQADLRAYYHARMLDDLGRFVDAAGVALHEDVSSVRSSLKSLEGKRLSPGIALAHVGFVDLAAAPQPVAETELREALSSLREVLDGNPIAERFAVDTVSAGEAPRAWEQRFRDFCISEADKAAPFYPKSPYKPTIGATPADVLAEHRNTIESVLAALSKAAPSSFRDIVEFISDLRVFRGHLVRGASAPSYFGAVFIREPEEGGDRGWLWFADHLTHEASHHRLYIACGDDTLVTEERTITSPVRSDPRPLSGVLHALWVETRLVQTFSALHGMRDELPIEDHGALEEMLHEFRRTHRHCLESIRPHLEVLTPVARRLFDHCERAGQPSN